MAEHHSQSALTSLTLTLLPLTRVYPFLKGTGAFCRTLARVGLAWREPSWEVARICDGRVKIALDLSKTFQRQVFFFTGAFERHYLQQAPLGECLRRELKPGSIFLDIGANIGFYSLYAASLVGPRGRVLSFEPAHDAFASLSRSAAANGFDHCQCLRLALSDNCGQRQLYLARDSTANSLNPEVLDHSERYLGSDEVQVAVLDEEMKRSEISVPRIDLVKIDVEGEEARVVRGMTESLQRGGYPPLWIEVRGQQGSTRAPATFAEVCRVLAQFDYLPFRPGNESLPIPAGGVSGCEDVLFRSRRRSLT